MLGRAALWTPLRNLLHYLSDAEQRLLFDAMLRDLVRKYLRYGPVTHSMQKNGLENESNVGGVAAMVAGVMKNNSVLEDHLVEWLTSNKGEYASLGLDTRRAVIATFALRQGNPFPAHMEFANPCVQRSCKRSLIDASRSLATRHRSSIAPACNRSVSFELGAHGCSACAYNMCLK